MRINKDELLPIFPPARPPGVLNYPIGSAVVVSVPDSQHCMVNLVCSCVASRAKRKKTVEFLQEALGIFCLHLMINYRFLL